MNRGDAVERSCTRTCRGLARLDSKGWWALAEKAVEEILVLPDRSVEMHDLFGPPRIGPDAEESV